MKLHLTRGGDALSFWLAVLSMLAVTTALAIILVAVFVTLRHLRRQSDASLQRPGDDAK